MAFGFSVVLTAACVDKPVAYDGNETGPQEAAIYCGDGIRQDTEVCDGSDLGAESCEGHNRTGGTLSCHPDCTLDLSGCGPEPVCGNGVLELGETCEGTDLEGRTCGDLGYETGTLACAGCLLDASGCAFCGDGQCQDALGEDDQSCPLDCAPWGLGANGRFTCSIRDDQTVWCWGANHNGQAGVEGEQDQLLPVQVLGLTDARRIALGREHACAVREDETVWCWGSNGYGQLGSDPVAVPERAAPELVAGLADVKAVSAGYYHSCALKTDGTAWCWGDNDGQLGTGDTVPSVSPRQVVAISDFHTISCGWHHTCGVRADGTAWCWGSGPVGQLGTGDSLDRLVPTQVVGLQGVRSISAGTAHTCAVLGDDTGWCWGGNGEAQLGYPGGYLVYSSEPVLVSGLNNVQSMAAGFFHSCAVLRDGTARCWGQDNHGQLGSGTIHPIPEPSPLLVSGLVGVSVVRLGSEHTCALSALGTVWCWGNNARGERGDGAPEDSAIPLEIH